MNHYSYIYDQRRKKMRHIFTLRQNEEVYEEKTATHNNWTDLHTQAG